LVQRVGQLDTELNWLRGIPLLVCDEVGYIPLRPRRRRQSSTALVANGYERLPHRVLGKSVLYVDGDFDDAVSLRSSYWVP
jgi:hypothetical protein